MVDMHIHTIYSDGDKTIEEVKIIIFLAEKLLWVQK